MNDVDYLDSILILSYKLNSDNAETLLRRIRTSKYYELVKVWIKENIDKYLENYCMNFLYLGYESDKHGLNLIEPRKLGDIAKHSLVFLERANESGRTSLVNYLLI
jgi:hypothetical protein